MIRCRFRSLFRQTALPLGITLLFVASFRQDAVAQDQGSATDARSFSIVPTVDPAGWEIRFGGELFAAYRSDFKGTPIVFPLIAPGGHQATRGFPILPVKPTEEDDHDHHRALWLTHGEVNDIDFWIDEKGCGKIVQTSGSATVDEQTGAAVISTRNDWNSPDGKRVLSDSRRFAFHVDGDAHVVDCDFVLHATDGPVHFGDTKEGSFGIRVPGTMKVDSKLGGKITNDKGEHDGNAWGKRSAWVDYSGPVDDSKLSITIHEHPSSFNFPCRWHVRTYGLFAANPFGEFHFTGGDKTPGYTLPTGESLKLSFRIVLREGNFDAERTKADSEAYAEANRPTLN